MRRRLATSLISSLAAVCLPVITGSVMADDTHPISKPSPSPHPSLLQEKEAWKRVIQLVSLHDGYISPSEFERIFKVHLEDRGTETIDGGGVLQHTYSSPPQSDWPFYSNVFEFTSKDETRWSLVGIDFRDQFELSGLTVPCLNITPLLEELDRAGWKNSGTPSSGNRHAPVPLSVSAVNPHTPYVVRLVTDPDKCLNKVVIVNHNKE